MENKCLWKSVYQDNINGKGTSFVERKSDFYCADCSGNASNDCVRYFPLKKDDNSKGDDL
ncbi:hypothetical protein J4231_03635 [Candidatus Woesearchaeota archaeon]|nr:hypothetical protein [Candidatus Woesearchaeota archaeon]